MTYATLISASDLAQNLNQPNWRIVDCRFYLTNTQLGREKYQQGHIPGAIYAHLDEDLSGPIIPGQTGRHPLPGIEAFSATLSSWGIDSTVQVIAYDDMGGAIAARLWWMLRWLGHNAVAVLNGGLQAWEKAGLPLNNTVPDIEARQFLPQPQAHLLMQVDEVVNIQADPAYRLFDSRSADRYRGENETIDPVAGHIPGAISAPFAHNLNEEKQFRPPPELAERFNTLLGDVSAEQAVFYCGSGVTAAHNLLAMAHAGLPEAKLYAGSWSEWITDPARPVER